MHTVIIGERWKTSSSRGSGARLEFCRRWEIETIVLARNVCNQVCEAPLEILALALTSRLVVMPKLHHFSAYKAMSSWQRAALVAHCFEAKEAELPGLFCRSFQE